MYMKGSLNFMWWYFTSRSAGMQLWCNYDGLRIHEFRFKECRYATMMQLGWSSNTSVSLHKECRYSTMMSQAFPIYSWVMEYFLKLKIWHEFARVISPGLCPFCMIQTSIDRMMGSIYCIWCCWPKTMSHPVIYQIDLSRDPIMFIICLLCLMCNVWDPLVTMWCWTLQSYTIPQYPHCLEYKGY